jgi:hypothetical protein
MTLEILPTLVEWSFNFDLNGGVKRPKLKLHAAEAGGISSGSLRWRSRSKLKHHAAEAGGVCIFFTAWVVSGFFRSSLTTSNNVQATTVQRNDLNHPPTAVGGIHEIILSCP